MDPRLTFLMVTGAPASHSHHVTPPEHAREALLLALTGISWFTTPRNREIRSANAFNFAFMRFINRTMTRPRMPFGCDNCRATNRGVIGPGL